MNDKMNNESTNVESGRIDGLGDDKSVVQKSIPLLELYRSDFTLAEFKVLDIYLSRINSHNPDKKTVVFTKKELEDLLGVTRLNIKELKIRLKHLMGNVVEIPDGNSPEEGKMITIFESADFIKNGEGQLYIKLECTSKAKKYIFSIEVLKYIQYKIKCITSLTSRYSYVLYSYLKQYEKYSKKWTIPLDKLRSLLNCNTDKYKTNFKYFNRDILKKSQAEINEKTDIRFEYEPVKTGRTVTAIRFKVKALPEPDLDALEDDENIIDEPEPEKESENLLPPDATPAEKTDTEMEKELWETAIAEFDFTPEQINELREVLVCVPTCRLPEDNTSHTDAIDIRRYHYMRQQTTKIKARGNVKNPFAYLIKMIEQDTAE